jgi:peptide/nickel transport system permease protein
MISKPNTVGTQQSPSFLQRRLDNIFSFTQAMSKHPIAFVAMCVVVCYLFIAVFGGAIAPFGYDSVQDDLARCVTRSNGSTRCAALENSAPTPQYLFGTDRNGRDVFSRLLHGARYTIGLPLIATALSVTLGTLIGLAIGYWGGGIDELVLRLFDTLLAIPSLVLALVAISTIVPTLQNLNNPFIESIGAVNISLIIVITLLYTPIVTRVIRAATLSVRDVGYIEAAKLRGESTLYILLREIFPSVIPALAVEASLRFSYAIFLVASLGFLGLGAQPPIPEWGRMVLDARNTANTAPWALWYPVLTIAILIISVNLMADGLQRVYRSEQNR